MVCWKVSKISIQGRESTWHADHVCCSKFKRTPVFFEKENAGLSGTTFSVNENKALNS